MLVAGGLLVGVSRAHAQDMEPRSYSNAPVGLNFLVAGYGETRGGLAFDSSVPLTNPQLTTSSTLLAYGRVLDFLGQSAKLTIIVPYGELSGSADYAGEALRRDVSGFADPVFKVSVNVYGAPALSLREFAAYEQDLIVGASLRVSAPLGQYDDRKAVNLGTNRWSFKPELGISKALGKWTLEGTAAATLFTDNEDFFNGNRRSQDPLYALEGHVIYSFAAGIWGSLDANYFAGGRTTLDGTQGSDLQQNWRFGATLAFPMTIHHSIKLYGSSGVSARTGNNFDLLGIAWQYRWGAGL
ncbi:transporter [Candidatus Accumulibacter sp. ACC007]|uniref:transporter n=1 Tax=Candidatus Accumulibacter sp. ACC007 TaxID=2823333 RepID=UPI0025C1FD26|nr:transporter [Candidatus Accumulibacter sp. ACC007]